MRRTAVLYATALATLVAAFLLVPREKNAAPPPPKDPPRPTAKGPVTHLNYADATLSVDARLDRGYLHAHPGAVDPEPLYLDVTLKALGAAKRAPLAIVLVIDRSGSMAGEKIDAARMAAQRLVERLQDGDLLAIVSYGTDVTVDLPLTPLSPTSRAEARRTIARLEEGGGTNIDGGLAAALRLFASPVAGHVARAVLLSDGRATEGERRTERLAEYGQRFQKAGVTLSTLGVGLDYHEDLMERLAVEGGGRYHYLRHTSQLGAILDDELRHASSVVARGVKLHLPRHLGPFHLDDAPGFTVRREAESSLVIVGDLAAGEMRRVLIRLAPKGGADASPEVVLRAPEVTYATVGEQGAKLLAHRDETFRVLVTDDAAFVEKSRDEDVRARVLQVTSSLAVTESMRALSRGDVPRALQNLEAHKQKLETFAKSEGRVELAEEAQNLDRLIRTVQAAAPASEKARDLVKYEKARAYEMRR